MIWSFMIMGIATMLIAFLPTYATIGVAAPILLILLRLVQGSPPAPNGAVRR